MKSNYLNFLKFDSGDWYSSDDIDKSIKKNK